MSFSFGAPSSAPASSGLGGFSFGAAKPATPGFGLTATSQPSGFFGSTATTSASAFGAAPAFGASTTSAFGANSNTSFGAAAPAFGSTSFGASATPAFGATSAAPAFGSTATSAFGATSTAPAFGATPTPAFGATSTAPAFGATATPAFGATSAAPAFGSTTTPAFGATATPAFGATTAPAFGAASQPAFGATTSTFGQASAPSFGAGLGTGGLNFGTSTASTGLNFGAPASTANTGLGGFGFGAASTQSSFGFGAGATTTGSLFGGTLGMSSATGTQLSTTVTPSLGLGGLGHGGVGTTNATTGDKSEPPKQNKLPNEILTNVESFKEFVKKQKSMSSDIMRVSTKPLHKVSQEAESTLRQALSLSSEVSRARAAAARLRSAAAAALAHAENCARDVIGMELEGTAPPAYIKELLSELEQQIITFRRQMEVADKQMQSSPKLLTEQELTLGIRRMHESLVALAGRLQAAHAQVQAQKEQYLNLRKYLLNDATDVFSSVSTSAGLDQILRDAEGTRKKSKTGLSDTGLGRAVLADPRAALGSISQLAGPTPFSTLGNSLSPFPGADASGSSSWQPPPPPAAAPPAGPFQLQKPPGKRGKQ